jgi:hypothetical protein
LCVYQQQCLLWLCFCNRCYRGADAFLQARSQHYVSAASHLIYPNSRLCLCWSGTKISRPTRRNDLASNLDVGCNVHYIAQRGEYYSQWMEDYKMEILFRGLAVSIPLLLPSWTAFPSTQLLQRHHMVCPEECGRRKSLWCCF